jgi:hypothetical protein
MSEHDAVPAGWYPTDQGPRYWTGTEWGPLAPRVPSAAVSVASKPGKHAGRRWSAGIVAALFTYGALFKGGELDFAIAVFLWWVVAALAPGWTDRSKGNRNERIVLGLILLMLGAGAVALTVTDPGGSSFDRFGEYMIGVSFFVIGTLTVRQGIRSNQ